VVLRDEPQPDWPALPAARDEARRVAASYHDSHVLADDVATPRHVLERLDAIDVLHVAAHAVAGRDPGQTGLLLRADTGDGNALLSAEDLDRLAHTGRPRVAVLASCRTAEGAASLEGPLSLARGFLALGTSAVIASLWDLPDAASARLVPALHRRLADGVAPARALREVQLEAIRAAGRDADPIGWASLVVVGNLASASRRAPGETTRTSVYSRSGG
jgi:CHAT domain-containing protein